MAWVGFLFTLNTNNRHVSKISMVGWVRGFLTVPCDKIQTGGGDQVLVSQARRT